METSSIDDSSAYKVCSNDDLLSKILICLPVSSLRLFRSVSKGWLSIITDQYFNSLYRRNAHHPRGLFLSLQPPSSVFPVYLPLKTSSHHHHPPPPLVTTTTTRLPFYPSTHMVLLQSCNGLLLCYDFPDKFYVCNPTINCYKLIPQPRTWKPNSLLRFMALAFDPKVSTHYKIVWPGMGPGGDVFVEIYSSETGFWKACPQTDFSLATFMTFTWRVVYWHGAIHWLAGKCLYHLILLDEEIILQVEDLESLYGMKYVARDKLFVSLDCLLLVKILQEPFQINVYEVKNMNDYCFGLSIKYHVNLQSAGNFLGSYFEVPAIVLGEREEDSYLVLEENVSVLIQYNISSNTFHQLCDLTHIRHHQTQYDSFLFTPSLVGV